VYVFAQLNSAKVIAVGLGNRDKNGNVIPVSFKEGDEVLLPEYGGTEVKLGDKMYAPQPPSLISFFYV
jgi:chaperonin GroES